MSLALLANPAVASRLENDEVIWLTTVRRDGQPQSSPVWFVWNGVDVLIFSRPDATKVLNLASNPLVALHLDDRNGAVVILEGRATLNAHVAVGLVDVYAAKYRDGFARLGTDASTYLGDFSTAIMVRPTRARVFIEQ